MDGNASGIHGGDAGGGDDDHALRAAFFELSEERSFTRAGLAGQGRDSLRVAEDAEGEGCLVERGKFFFFHRLLNGF